MNARVFASDNLADFDRTFDAYWRFTKSGRRGALLHTADNFSFLFFKRLQKATVPKGFITNERLAAFKIGEGLKISDRARALTMKKYGVVEKNGRRYMIGSAISKAGSNAGKLRGLTKSQSNEIARLNKSTGGGITLQALMAKTELSLRESHRSFTASSARFFREFKQQGGVVPQGYSWSSGNDTFRKVTFSKTKHGRQLGMGKSSVGAEADQFQFDWGTIVGKFSAMAAAGLNSPSRNRLLNAALNDTRLDMMKYIERKQAEAARNAARTIARA